VADNPHRNLLNCHETRKGGQGPTLGCSANDDDDDDDDDDDQKTFHTGYIHLSMYYEGLFKKSYCLVGV
jgi:hypothetical protein